MKTILLPILVVSVGLLTACQPTSSTAVPATTQEKVGDTTKSGTITGAEGGYFLQVTGEQPLAIDSYSIDLKQYVGSQVTVTGQYSGNTLFIGSIQ